MESAGSPLAGVEGAAAGTDHCHRGTLGGRQDDPRPGRGPRVRLGPLARGLRPVAAGPVAAVHLRGGVPRDRTSAPPRGAPALPGGARPPSEGPDGRRRYRVPRAAHVHCGSGRAPPRPAAALRPAASGGRATRPPGTGRAHPRPHRLSRPSERDAARPRCSRPAGSPVGPRPATRRGRTVRATVLPSRLGHADRRTGVPARGARPGGRRPPPPRLDRAVPPAPGRRAESGGARARLPRWRTRPVPRSEPAASVGRQG